MILQKEHIAISVACFIAGGILGAGLRSCVRPKQPTPEPIVLHDTLSIRDTIRIQGKTRTIYLTQHDTLITHQHDTVIDTFYVQLPIEHKEYCDTFTTDTSSITLGVQFSGYKAKIDSVGIDYTFATKERVKLKKNGWGQFVGIGIGAGYGATVIDKQVFGAPEVGVHITYGWGYHW